MSGLPMMADSGHAFSGGSVSSVPRVGSAPEQRGGSGEGNESHRGAVSFTARRCYGNTGEWATLEEPACREVARFPTLEAAQAYARKLGDWLDARPDPSVVEAFFDGSVRVEPTYESLLAILERAERPERM